MPISNCLLPPLGNGFEYTEVCPGAFVDFCTGSPPHREDDIIGSVQQARCEGRKDESGTDDVCSYRLEERILVEHQPCDVVRTAACSEASVDFCADGHIREEDATERMEGSSGEGRDSEHGILDLSPCQLDVHIHVNRQPFCEESDEVRSDLPCNQATVLVSPVDGGNPEAKSGTNDEFPFMVEASTTNRARCRACREPIRAGAPRCGARVWFKVRWEVRWCHASCFLRGVGALYSKSGRRRCRATGRVFAAGDLEVRLGFGDPYTYSSWWPEAATRLTHAAARRMGRSAVCEAIRGWREAAVGAGLQDGVLGGLGALSPDDRDMLCRLLIPHELPEPRSFHHALASREASRLDLTEHEARLNLLDNDDRPVFLDADLVNDVARPAFLDLTENGVSRKVWKLESRTTRKIALDVDVGT